MSDSVTFATFASLQGKTIVSIDGLEKGSEGVTFRTSDGSQYEMYHQQDCCEVVQIEDVTFTGCIDDLIGVPVLVAEESSADAEADEWCSGTWTFYKIATVKGWVDIRWLGESNGYYSESVDFVKVI